MIYKAFYYRIYPTKQQRTLFARFFGCTRFVWNFFLNMKRQEYLTAFVNVSESVCKSELTKLKHDEDYEWLLECDSTALQRTIEDLQQSIDNFFAGRANYPRFKSKKEHNDSYTAKCIYDKSGNANIRLGTKYLKLPKVGLVRTKVSRPIDGRIINATVSKKSSGKYFVSVLCEVPEYDYTFSESGEVGLDVGIKDYCVTSDGFYYKNYKPLQAALKKLKHEQRVLSRKTSGSARFEKQRIKVARLHEKVSNIRHDYLNKLSTELVRKYDFIGAESLDVKQMLQDNGSAMSRNIQDCSWSLFLQKLEYKCKWYGRTLVKVSTFYPSSQLCSNCGFKNEAVKDLSIRIWTCPNCGAVHDRDENASKNTLKEAKRICLAGSTT